MSTFSEMINAFTAGCSLIAAVATLLLVVRKVAISRQTGKASANARAAAISTTRTRRTVPPWTARGEGPKPAPRSRAWRNW